MSFKSFGSIASSIVAQLETVADQQPSTRAPDARGSPASAVRGKTDGHQFQQRKERV